LSQPSIPSEETEIETGESFHPEVFEESVFFFF